MANGRSKRNQFRHLGVTVENGRVRVRRASPTMALIERQLNSGSGDLGPLAGTQAQITDGTRQHRVGTAVAAGALTGGLGLLAGLTTSRKAYVVLTFADGTSRQFLVKGNSVIRNAQAEAIRFNALAQATTRPVMPA